MELPRITVFQHGPGCWHATFQTGGPEIAHMVSANITPHDAVKGLVQRATVAIRVREAEKVIAEAEEKRKQEQAADIRTRCRTMRVHVTIDEITTPNGDGTFASEFHGYTGGGLKAIGASEEEVLHNMMRNMPQCTRVRFVVNGKERM